THDQVEAMTMADRIVVLNAGRIEQVGTPLELYHAPCNIFVAGFIGSPRMNILEVRVDDDESAVALPDGTRLALPADWAGKPAVTRLSLGVRPENIIIGAPSDDALLAEVFVVERLGASALVHARLSSGETIVVVTEGTSPLRVGDRISVRFNPASLHLFGADGRTVKYPETWAELAPTPV
ncbi:MAG: TOBE domain-containing protein, partial [Devosia sp.]|nr:TOBE domain-containing protein [Devosia sp.]